MPDRIPYHKPFGSRASKAAYARAPERKADQAFYDSAAWKRTRTAKLAINPLCEPCQARGEITPAEQVHHKVERKARPDLAYEMDNLESVCRPCHNAKRATRASS